MNNQVVIERNVNSEAINSLENLALSHIESIEKLKQQIKETNEMINDGLVSNETYVQANEKAKEFTKKKSQVKQQVMSQPSMVALALKLKSLKDEKKEKQQSLSDYLLEYERMTGANVIETPKGEQLTIFKTAVPTKTR